MPAHRTPRWSQAEIAILEEFYPSEGIACVEYLPGRTWKSVHQKAFKLGISCEKQTAAPTARLGGEELEEAIRLREQEGWSFARIGATFQISESAACNAVLIALCPRHGYTPAERDETGCLTERGLERVRYALKKGLKGIDIQLRLGVSASCVAEQRRRYNADLKARGKAPLPPPGGGEKYSGVKLTRAQIREVEALFLGGYGTAKVSEKSGASKTSCTRIRNRLVARLRRQGKALPGCDERGVRHLQRESSRFVPPELVEALKVQILDRVPVRRAARLLAIGLCSAYRIRDQLRAELEAEGRTLPEPVLPGRVRKGVFDEKYWPPESAKQIYQFRQMLHHMDFAEAKTEWQRVRREEVAAERTRPKSFEEQLRMVREGKLRVVPAFHRHHLEPTVDLARANA